MSIYTRTVASTFTFVIPDTHEFVRDGYPVQGEQYMYLTTERTDTRAVCDKTTSSTSWCIPATHVIVVRRKRQLVVTFRHTGVTRLPQLGEWFATTNSEIPYQQCNNSFHSTPRHIVERNEHYQ